MDPGQNGGATEAVLAPISAALDDRYRIATDSPLPNLSSPRAKAYMVADSSSSLALAALVCDPGLPLRTDVMAVARRYQQSGMIRLIDWGVIHWTPTEDRRVAAIFEAPGGGRLVGPKDASFPVFADDTIADRIVRPVATALRLLLGSRLTHRNIRPDNMFFSGDAQGPLVLGECVTAPAGFYQPVLFETIERGMADPIGRGEGTISDDLYALGAVVATMLFGRNIGVGVSDQAVIAAKLEHGSYGALVKRQAVPRELVELLRGLLEDDVRERWTLEDLEQWLGGRRLRPRKLSDPDFVHRAFNFAGKEYHNRRALAQAFSQNWSLVRPAVQSEDLTTWMTRYLNDEEHAEAVIVGVSAAANLMSDLGGGGDSDARLLSKVCMALDPRGPIRFKSVSVAIDGLGPAFAAAHGDEAKLRDLADLLNTEQPLLWIEMQDGVRPTTPEYERKLRSMIHEIKQPGPGHGIERCLYELNPTFPCQSPLLHDAYVQRLDDFLPALEARVQTIDVDGLPIDRHMAAFLGARVGSDAHWALSALADRADRNRVIAGNLGLLGLVQERSGCGPLKGLTTWMATKIGPVIESYQNRPLRAKVTAEAARFVKAGDLAGLHRLLSDARRRRWDQSGAAAARTKYVIINSEIARYQAGFAQYVGRSRTFGHFIASLISGAIATWVVVGQVVQHVG